MLISNKNITNLYLILHHIYIRIYRILSSAYSDIRFSRTDVKAQTEMGRAGLRLKSSQFLLSGRLFWQRSCRHYWTTRTLTKNTWPNFQAATPSNSQRDINIQPKKQKKQVASKSSQSPLSCFTHSTSFLFFSSHFAFKFTKADNLFILSCINACPKSTGGDISCPDIVTTNHKTTNKSNF